MCKAHKKTLRAFFIFNTSEGFIKFPNNNRFPLIKGYVIDSLI